MRTPENLYTTPIGTVLDGHTPVLEEDGTRTWQPVDNRTVTISDVAGLQDALNESTDIANTSGTLPAARVTGLPTADTPNQVAAKIAVADDAAVIAAARGNLGLGTAAPKDTGTAIGNVVELVNVGGNPGLPAVDGSALTGVGGSTAPLVLTTNAVEQRNGTNAQTYRLAKTYTSATNFESLELKATPTGYQIGSTVGSAGGSNQPVSIGHTDAAGNFTAGLTFDPATGEIIADSVIVANDPTRSGGSLNGFRIAQIPGSSTFNSKTGLFSRYASSSPGWALFQRGESSIAATINYTGPFVNQNIGFCFGNVSGINPDTFLRRLSRNSLEISQSSTTSNVGKLSAAINLPPITAAALAATTAAADAGQFRVIDSTPPNRPAYPDGTVWRYISDDVIVS